MRFEGRVHSALSGSGSLKPPALGGGVVEGAALVRVVVAEAAQGGLGVVCI